MTARICPIFVTPKIFDPTVVTFISAQSKASHTEKIKRRKRKSDEKLSSIFYFQLKDGQKIILYYLQSYGAFVSNDEDYYVPLSDEDMRKIERIIKNNS